MTTTQEIGWVADEAQLSRLCTELRATSLAAVDTEFVREKTYYPQLCLIQIGTKSQVACIDCLAGLDLTPLYAEIFRPDFTWVVHSASQDLEVVWQLAGRLPPTLVDTQIAAALLGYPPQVGLETLLKRTLDIDLGESYARTDWSRRPLPEEAIRYALDDVRYLLAAWDRLHSELVALGRQPWFAEDCAREIATPPEPDLIAVWARLKGVHGLSFASQCAALALVRWREAAAQRSDRPRRWLLADEELLTIAAALPVNTDTLGQLMPPKFVARFGEAVLMAIAEREDASLQAETRANAAQAAPDKAVVKGLQEQVRQRATALKLEPEILATRRDLVGVALGRPPEHLRSGWRSHELASLISGSALPAEASRESAI